MGLCMCSLSSGNTKKVYLDGKLVTTNTGTDGEYDIEAQHTD